MGFALKTIINRETKQIVWSVQPEWVRFYAYLYFWLMVGIGAWLTFGHSHADFEHNPIMNRFGYNNICILFDSYPSTYVLPSIWSIGLILLASYVLTSWIRVYQQYAFDQISRRNFMLFSASSLFEVLCFVVFTTVFSVGPDESMFAHLAPFTFLIVALSTLSAKNFTYYHSEANLGPIESKLSIAYLVVHLIASAAKILMQVNVLSDDALYNTLDYVPIHQLTDRIWMLTAAVLPVYFALKFRNRVPALEFVTNIK